MSGDTRAMRWLKKGFTAIELIIVILVMSVFAIAIGFGIDIKSNASDIAANQLIADIRYVQMRAVGLGNQQSISFTTGSVTYTVAGEQKHLTGGVTVSSTSFGTTLIFNSQGEPITLGTGDGTITLSGGRSITIYGVTGKAE